MKQYIDHSVYPDVDPEKLPTRLDTEEERSDYLHRLCGAWDFDIFPEPETFALLSGWRETFDRFQLNGSPAYHTFRRVFGWPDVPMVKNDSVRLAFAIRDRLEGRQPDPFLDVV